MKLGEKIRLLRGEKNLTQPELAERAGIEQSYLSKLENEKGTPSYEIIGRIAEAFEMGAMELIGSLDQAYIESNLAHIPEVAAENTAIRYKQEAKKKTRYVFATICISIALGLSIFAIIAPQIQVVAYTYFSPGVLESEVSFTRPVERMITSEMLEVDENSDFLLSYEYLGEEFLSPTENAGRYYYLTEEVRVANPITNEFVALIIGMIGIFLLVVGICAFSFDARFVLHWK